MTVSIKADLERPLQETPRGHRGSLPPEVRGFAGSQVIDRRGSPAHTLGGRMRLTMVNVEALGCWGRLGNLGYSLDFSRTSLGFQYSATFDLGCGEDRWSSCMFATTPGIIPTTECVKHPGQFIAHTCTFSIPDFLFIGLHKTDRERGRTIFRSNRTVLYTSILYVHNIHRIYTSILYVHNLHIIYTSILYVHNIHRIYTSILYVRNLHRIYTSILYVHNLHRTTTTGFYTNRLKLA